MQAVKKLVEDSCLAELRIRACTRSGVLSEARRCHAEILSSGKDVGRDKFVANLLVQMYGACGSVEDAARVFRSIQEPNAFSYNIMIVALVRNGCVSYARDLFDKSRLVFDTVSWNVMIKGYIDSGWIDEARQLFWEMPRRSTYASNALLAAYARNGQHYDAQRLFETMTASTRRDLFSWTGLMTACSQAGAVSKAKMVFDAMPVWDVVSWNVIISAHTQNGHLKKAKALFDEMPERSTISWNAMVQAYCRSGFLEEAKMLFESTAEKNVVSWTGMLTAYAHKGCLDEAANLFHTMPVRNVVSWTAMLQAHLQREDLEEAVEFAGKMPQHNDMAWNSITIAYAQRGDAGRAKAWFDAMSCRNAVSWAALVIAYSQAGCLDEAQASFARMPRRDAVSCNEMLLALGNAGLTRDAKAVFEEAILARDVLSFTAMVTALGRGGNVKEARLLFDRMPQRDVVSWNSMIHAYAQNDCLDQARDLFGKTPEPDLVCCNAMIHAFARNGLLDDAKSLFDGMVVRNLMTWTGMIAACAQLGCVDQAMLIFSSIPDKKDVVAWTALVAAYASNGDMEGARAVLDRIPFRDIPAWNAAITGYTLSGHPKQALELFATMDVEGLQGNAVTFVGVLDACGNMASIRLGADIDDNLAAGCSEASRSVKVGNALLSMYGKCGRLDRAWEIFVAMQREQEHKKQDELVSWNAMVGAYAQNGHSCAAVDLFRVMNVEGVEPDGITFVSLLSACGHGGMLQTTRWSFESLVGRDYEGIDASLTHYMCVIDGLGRAALAEQAEDLIRHMPFHPDPVAWATLLGSSGVDAGGDWLMELDPANGAAYILLANIHSRMED